MNKKILLSAGIVGLAAIVSAVYVIQSEDKPSEEISFKTQSVGDTCVPGFTDCPIGEICVVEYGQEEGTCQTSCGNLICDNNVGENWINCPSDCDTDPDPYGTGNSVGNLGDSCENDTDCESGYCEETTVLTCVSGNYGEKLSCAGFTSQEQCLGFTQPLGTGGAMISVCNWEEVVVGGICGPKCGNGILEGINGNNEQCDDGNTTNGDGCDNICKKEGCTTDSECTDGQYCQGYYEEGCYGGGEGEGGGIGNGDGTPEPDGTGNTSGGGGYDQDGDTTKDPFKEECKGLEKNICNSTPGCQRWDQRKGTCKLPVCGDGTVDPGEECDIDGDGGGGGGGIQVKTCTSECKWQYTPLYCDFDGDGLQGSTPYTTDPNQNPTLGYQWYGISFTYGDPENGIRVNCSPILYNTDCDDNDPNVQICPGCGNGQLDNGEQCDGTLGCAKGQTCAPAGSKNQCTCEFTKNPEDPIGSISEGTTSSTSDGNNGDGKPTDEREGEGTLDSKQYEPGEQQAIEAALAE